MGKDFLFQTKNLKVLIIDNSASRRQIIAHAIGDLGFKKVTSIGSYHEVLNYLEVEDVDWIVSPLMAGPELSALSILKLLTEHHKFRSTRLSILLTEKEQQYIPLAFKLGALSWHNASYNRQDLDETFRTLINRFQLFGWDPVKLSGDYLYNYLMESKEYGDIENLCHKMIEIYPGDVDELSKLMVALKEQGQFEESLQYANMICAITHPPSQKTIAIKSWLENKVAKSARKTNTPNRNSPLGIENCAYIGDPKKQAHDYSSYLSNIGVENTLAFSTTDEAMEWFSKHGEPNIIILDWQASGTIAPVFIQKIRKVGYINAPILVIGREFETNELNLLGEFGIQYVFDDSNSKVEFYKKLIACVEQCRRPTEQFSFEIKIQNLLEAGNRDEAERLRLELAKNPTVSDYAKLAIEAEIAFYDGKLERAVDTALTAIKMKKTLRLLNLLGRCFLRLGSFSSAAQCFEEADGIAPDNIQRLCLLAEAKSNIGDKNSAEDVLTSAKLLDDKDLDVSKAECQIALNNEQIARAKSLMNDMPELKEFIALINNRAVVTVLNGSFEKALKLYKSTIDAIPDEWSDIKVAVQYNLALASAKYGNLEEALTYLSEIHSDTDPRITKKSTSLKKKVEIALKNGSALVINQNSQDITKKSDIQAEDNKNAYSEPLGESYSNDELNKLLQARKGDMCCYLIYEPNAKLLKDVEKELVQILEIKPRSHISREEAALKNVS